MVSRYASVREVKDIPIIMVSAKKEDIDKIRGLELVRMIT